MADPLLPYQETAADWMSLRSVSLLADAPRVGKTAAAIGACDRLGAKNVLWVTTGSARADHTRAWRRFQTIHRQITTCYTAPQLKKASLRGVTIVSYDILQRAWPEIQERADFGVLVLDEMHKLKGKDSKRTQVVYGTKCQAEAGSVVSKATFILALSGTPAPNNYAELWPFLRACAPDAIRDVNGKAMAYWTFAERFCRLVDNGFGVKIAGNKNAEDLKNRLSGLTMRRTLADIAPQVPKLRSEVLPLGDMKQVRELRAIENDRTMAELAGVIDDPRLTDDQRNAMMAGVMKRVDARIPRLTGEAKVDPVIEWILDQDIDKLVIFGWHTVTLERLWVGLGGHGSAVKIDGSVTGVERGQRVERFMIDPKCRFFIGQIQAAGEAIDLSVADEILFVESSWVPGHNEQAAMRVVNVNKTRPTLARFATIPGSIDEKVQSVAAAKLADIQKLF